MIVVTGATGNVGSRVAAGLRDRGEQVRAFVRNAARATARLGGGIELAVGDFENPASLRAALDGADALFLASANHPHQAEHESAVIDAAATAGVRRVVKLSTIGAHVGSPLAFWDHHGRSEAHLRSSGLPAVILRPSFYMTNLLSAAEQIRQHGALTAPAAGARLALTHPHDVADVAVVALMTDGHEGRTYVITGPEAMTYERIAAELTAATERQVAFVSVADDAAHAAFLASGIPPWFAQQLIILFGCLRQDAAAETTDTVRTITAHEPRTFRHFVHEHAALFYGHPEPAPLSVESK